MSSRSELVADQASVPPHAYVPGQTPRHDEGAFADLLGSVYDGMSAEALATTAAWKTGLVWLDHGYFWEAHELLEPVWSVARPNSVERTFVQAVIQLANAALKLKMGRPRAALRLCAMARGHLTETRVPEGVVMGLRTEHVADRIRDLEKEAEAMHQL